MTKKNKYGVYLKWNTKTIFYKITDKTHMSTIIRNILCGAMLACHLTGRAQQPFRGTLQSRQENLTLRINLYEEKIEVPGLEFLGPGNGYLSGNVYGIWNITSHRNVDEKTAIIRLSNDLGSDTQEVELTAENDSTYVFRQKGKVYIKKVVNRKLVKLPPIIRFTKLSD